MNAPTFPVIRLPMLQSVELPPLMRVALPHPRGAAIADIEAAVASELAASEHIKGLASGARVAVAVGSRGIAHIDRVAAGAVAHLKERGFDVFVVPGMASHGGGTPEGQVEVLGELGVTEESVGAPIHATMEVVEYGLTSDGIPCCFDKNAAGADGVVVINRVKSHTSFTRPIESGLTKMVAIGLGKAEGARNVHRLGVHGMTHVLPEIAEISLAHSPIVCGLALIENGFKELVKIEGVAPGDFLESDKRLLKESKALHQRLPFKNIGGLIVEWIGKEISGSGMDSAVTGRYDFRDEWLDAETKALLADRPVVVKIGVLGVTPDSHGSGVGIGIADYTTRGVASGLDLYKMYFNCTTAALTEAGRMPLVLPDDRDLVSACAGFSWAMNPAEARLCQIRSTLHLDEVFLSPSLFAEIEGAPGVEILEGPQPIRFADDGTLLTRLSSPEGL
jgi:hypothetical protein